MTRLAVAGIALAILAGCSGAPAATPSPTPTPTPTPTPDPGPALIRAFLANLDAGTITYHIAGRQTLTVSQNELVTTVAISQETDVRGSDAYGTVTLSEAGGSQTLQVLIVGPSAYTRTTGSWQKAAGDVTGLAVNPFLKLTGASDLEYLGPTPGHATMRTLHSLVWLGGDLSALQQQLTDLHVNVSSDIVVTTDGLPVGVSLTGTVTGTSAGQPLTIEVGGTLDISKFGVPVSIPSPPPGAPAA
jgi:hypothetical protein